MAYWLYENVIVENDERAPQFALFSTTNWMKALSFEINNEHGNNSLEQFESCRKIFNENVVTKGAQLPLAAIYEPLFHSLLFCTTLISMNRSLGANIWTYPSAIISWYYSYYNGFRSILCANNQRVDETHTAVIKALNSSVRAKLPHPFNLVAVYDKDESYKLMLPNYPESQSSRLARDFDETRETAREMIVGYLNGTVKYEIDKTKKLILADKNVSFTDFRTKAAKELRNKRLQHEINFMHCAFRYRGKANYRDAIFMAYGQKDLLVDTPFLCNLANTARFSFICALAYVEKLIGKKTTKAFLDDLKVNLRGGTSASSEELFWKEFAI